MKLMVSQNKPFQLLHDTWKAGKREILPLDDDVAREQIQKILAKVLSNRKPPYSLKGGLYDAMKDTGGDVLLASNQEAKDAAALFEEAEGIDLHPAAAVATATLINAVRDGSVDKNALIMLNITGGGEERFKKEYDLHYLKPSHVFDLDPDPKIVADTLAGLFA
jgi:cysteate synthase